MNVPEFVIERHRLKTDARQFGMWCFRIAADGTRSVLAYAMPREGAGAPGWTVYCARTPVLGGLTREEAEAMLRKLAEDSRATSPLIAGGVR